MKITCFIIALLAAGFAGAQTTTTVARGRATSPAVSKPTAFSPVSLDGSSTVWERTLYLPGTNGTVVARKSHYTQLESGVNYLNGYGLFVPSKEQIDILPQGGAQAVQGQIKASFPGDIFKGAIAITTPDGKKLKGRPLLLSYDDNTNTVLLGQLKHSVGVLVSSNRVAYFDAFDGIKADVIYDYRNGAFSQSVVLREQPPSAESLNLAPNAQLQLLTEFTGSEEPAQKAAARNQRDNLQDTTLSFGNMTLIQGKAFSMGESGGNSSQNNQSRLTSAAIGKTPTYKSWIHVQNRSFLNESVSYQRLASQLEQLPLMSRIETTGTNLTAANSILHKVSTQRWLPPELKEETDTGKILLASADTLQKPGVVLDYEAVISSTDDFTFASGETYYVSGAVYLSGLTTIQGNSVIKYDTNYTCGINILGTVQCATSPDHPAILTSADDNSVGEPITTGSPNNGTGSLTLWVDGDSGMNLADLTFWIWDGNGNYIVNGQPLIPSRYWEQWQGHYYEPIVFPAGVGQGYEFGGVCDGEYWESAFYPTLNTGTLTLSSGGVGTYQNLSYSETGDPLATMAGGAVGLSLPNGASVNDLVIRNLGAGIQSGYGLCSVTNVQFLHCGVAFDMEDYASLYAGNILMSQVDLGFSGQNIWVVVEHLTFDQGACLVEDINSGYDSFTLNNSLLTGITDYGNVDLSTNEVVPLSSAAGVYATAGNANYYLATGSPYRNTGTTGIAPDLWAGLQTLTTYAPQDGGSPDADTPDLGYHYSVNADSDFDGIPDVWVWRHFGNYSHNGSDLDAGGINTLLYDYTNNLDPNVIQFSIQVANNYVATSTPTVQLNIASGFPSGYAVLVDNNIFAGANWVAYAGPTFTVNLGSTQGSHNVWIGLRGSPADANPVWQETTLVLDSGSPTISITSPPNNASQNTTRVNVTGTFSESNLKQITVNGVPAYINGNSFEAQNVPLVAGANTLTATLENRAGTTVTASVSATGSADPVDPVQLQPTPVAGFAPLTVSFPFSHSVPGTLQQVLYDFNGDGVTDQTATDYNPTIQHTYSTAGQYFPVVTIVTSAGRFSSTGGWNSSDPNRLRINVQSPPVQQGDTISITHPVDLKCDSAGNLYVLSGSSTATITEYTEYNGSYIVTRSLSGIGATAHGLDVDGAGNVYVADSGENQVLKFNPTTSSFQLATAFGSAGAIGKADKSTGTDNGEFNAPFDVAVSPDGTTLSVSDSGNNRIQQFSTTDGSFISTFGSSGSGMGQFNTPKGLTYDSAGYLYIVDSGNNRITVTLDSSVIGTSGASGTALGQFTGAVNLGVGSRGIYVAETGNNRVQYFDPMPTGDGASHTPFTVRGSVSTQVSLNQPNAVAAIADFLQEKIYIADTLNNRVLLCSLPDDNLNSIQTVWNNMKSHVASGDIDGALSYFSITSADDYRQQFLIVGKDNTISAINQIGTLTASSIDADSAEFYFTHTIGGQVITFPVDFANENGVWKIEEF